MSDVSCRVFEYFDVAAREYGFPVESLLAGLDISLDHLRDPNRRVPWSTWAVLCDRLEARIGPDGIRNISGQIKDMNMSRTFLAVTSSILSVERLYRAVCLWLAPHLFRHATYSVEVHGPGRITIDIRIPEELPGSVAWLRMNEGALCTIPSLVGAPDAQIRGQFTPHHGRFEVFHPAEPSWSERLWRRLRMRFDPDSTIDELAEMQRDLRSAYGKLAESERELHQVLERLPDPVSVWSDDGLVFSNRAWAESFPGGLDPRGQGLVHPDRPRKEVRLRGPDGVQRVYVSPPVSAVRFRGRDAVVLVLRDVTAERAEAEKTALSDRLTTLGTLAACVGHEINNPLAYVAASLECMSADLKRDGSVDRAALQEAIRSAMDGLDRVTTISQDLNTFARKEFRTEPVCVRQALKLALRICGNQIKHVARVQLDATDDLPPIAADASRVSQVFVNLVVNAAHAMAGGSPDTDRLTLRACARDGGVQVDVEDTGTGMEPWVVERAFEPFVTTKGQRGTGLGLAVCRKIVDEHGGWIDLKSTPGEGTRISVWFPAAQSLGPSVRPERTPEPSRQWRVLLVDDEPELARLVSRLLRPHRVESVPDGTKALARLRADSEFDAVVCDLMMPRMSGVELHRQMAEVTPELAQRTVFLTGGTFSDDCEAHLADVQLPCVMKPFRRDDLIRALQRVTEVRATTSPRSLLP